MGYFNERLLCGSSFCCHYCRLGAMTFSGGDGSLVGSSNEVILRDPPTDAISAVKFGQTSNQFLVASSWDGFVRLYDIQGETRCRAKFNHSGPVLDACFQVCENTTIIFI